VIQAVAPAVFLLGIVFGFLLYKFEERPVLVRLKISKAFQGVTPSLDNTVVQPEIDADTEAFLAYMHDDTQDDIKLKQYKPIKVRNRAPLAITARPAVTTRSMQRIRHYMDNQRGTDTQY
jgi:hypothetical protein